MKVTYIGHSGFMVETQDQILLFDCIADGIGRASAGTNTSQTQTQETGDSLVSRGRLPVLDPGKKLTVFISHAHGDHYIRDIWKLAGMHPDAAFFVSSDIPLSDARAWLDPQLMQEVEPVEPDREYARGDLLKVETLLSTDEGVAFYVTLQDGTTVFHAGDLLLWMWYDNSPEYNEWMEKTFYGELDRIRGRRTDVAFLPLDPRLERNAALSIDAYLQALDVKLALPMHFWKDYGFVADFAASASEKTWRAPVQAIREENQEFTVY